MSRIWYKVTLTPESPVAVLRSRASAQFVKTQDYLPGSTVRGAFAEIFINKRGTDDPDFRFIFVEEKIFFGDFLPGFPNQFTNLIPLTARACKRFGLKGHPKSHTDLLLNHMLNAFDEENKKCPECGEPIDRVSGYFIGDGKDGEIAYLSLDRQLRMHVGISRKTGTAYPGLLFSYEMLTEGKVASGRETLPLQFVGYLSALEEDANELFEGLWKVIPPQREHLSVGKARTRGLGELRIETIEKKEPVEISFEERWEAFNRAAYEWNGSQEKCYFSITFTSHLALKDELGRPVLGNIRPYHFSLPETVELCAAFLNPEVVSGWNAAQGLPKPDTHALGRGSVLGFSAPKSLEAEIQTRLQTLETEGIGERRAEGFGRFVVCHPIHIPKQKEKN